MSAVKVILSEVFKLEALPFVTDISPITNPDITSLYSIVTSNEVLFDGLTSLVETVTVGDVISSVVKFHAVDPAIPSKSFVFDEASVNTPAVIST